VKIGPNYGSGTRAAVNGTAPDGKSPAPAAPSSSASSVHISDLSARLSGADANLSAGAPFDVNKVEDIKAAITGGKFKVNTGVVADKLIANVQEMLGRPSR